jgi:hypothetical protein
MLHYHMVVLTRDTALKRAVKRLTTATGSTADFVGDASGIDPKRRPHLAIFDARRTSPDKLFFKKIPADTRILYILNGDALIEKLQLFQDERVTSLFCHDARFDDDEFISSATKALRGEVFGLQKYFPWGVTTFTMKVKSYEDKTKAIDILMRYAKLAGVRGPVRDRIQLVCDELMMNALYHAPVDEHGNELYAGRTVKELAHLEEVAPIQVQYGCSGRYFGVSVTDGGGSLTRKRALEYLTRAMGEVQIEDKATGAGLGLVSVMRSVSKLIFNLEPGTATEVIGLFDMELFAKGKIGARSLHIFTDEPDEAGDEDELVVQAEAPRRAGISAGVALFTVLLAVVATGLGTYYYLDSIAPANGMEAAMPTVRVIVDPEDALVRLNGVEIPAGERVLLSGERVELAVERPGYELWTFAASRDELESSREFHVRLAPDDGDRHAGGDDRRAPGR